MKIQLNTNLDSVHSKSNKVAESHFGLNYVYDWEQVGGEKWQTFDEIVEQSGATTLRYMGGVSAELYFDIRDPDATSRIDQNGNERPVMPLSEFLSYTNDLQCSPIIIIPASDKLTTDPYGSRGFDTSWETDLRNFIQFTLEKSMPTGISAFEIGNEYPGYMTSEEYGRIASAMVKIVDEEINLYWQENELEAILDQPEVIIEVWTSTSDNFSQEDLNQRNDKVIQEFSDEELDALDGVLTHIYIVPDRHEGLPNEHLASNMDNVVGYAMDIMDNWQSITDHDISYHITEYNIHFKYDEFIGLKQAAPFLEFFESSIRSGIDGMNFWSAQYHSTSLASSQGELMLAGYLFQSLAEETQDKYVLDIELDSESYEISGYYGQEEIILYISSTSSDVSEVNLSLLELGVDITGVEATVIGVDETTADGIYKDKFSDLETFQDPDASLEVVDASAGYVAETGYFDVELNPYEVLILKLDHNGILAEGSEDNEVIMGTSLEDLIIGSDEDDLIIGLAGDDTIVGSSGNDIMLGGSGADTLSGDQGSDFVFGQDGDDELYGEGETWDILIGGSGRDTLYGTDGNHVLIGGEGSDVFVVDDLLDLFLIVDFDPTEDSLLFV